MGLVVNSLSKIAVALVALLPNSAFAVPKAIALPAISQPQNALFEEARTNGTIPSSATFDYGPAPTYNPNDHLALVNIFKRGCTLPQGIVCYDGNACCNNPANSGDGWCCGSGKICGNGENGAYCGFSTVYTTVTTTIMSTISDLTTVTVSDAGSTEYETITSTKIVTSTVSDVDTATEVITITVTRAVARRAAATNLPASAEVYPTAREQQQPIIAQATPSTTPKAQAAHGFHIRDLLPRQQASTVVSTVFITEQETTTISGDTTITNLYTLTSTSTDVTTITFTSAINAKTTVQSTFTLTVDQANTNAANTGNSNTGTSTGSAQSQQTTGGGATGGGTNNSSSGLSTGAKAGIGAGVAGVAVIAGVFFAFMLYGRRKRNKNLNPSAVPIGAGAGVGYANIHDAKSGNDAPEAYTHYAQDAKYTNISPTAAAAANYNNEHYKITQPYPQQPELDSVAMASPASAPVYRNPISGYNELDSTSPAPQYSVPSPAPNVYEMQTQPVRDYGYQQPSAGGFHAELDGQGGRR
ncbi:hypothetical protein K505DRAFT_419420 [Melanomma pulvis-pyrius CBS 109.77]|uniref:Mid2 domain-containing protein n=1 Tax=Melanomma pulvis-pyrius CBS 109.77 TaxID=1314802 RepID=A0A6A6X495_9PLEO|nr:hypothetical protein K505DRAFT_419420 [Melanomma pulvis-pyrius CBS 109.77]